VHLSVSAPPSRAPSEIMRRIEGRSSTKRFESFPLRHFSNQANERSTT